MDFGRLHNLIKCVNVSELAIGIVYAMAMVFFSDFSEVLEFGSILLHVLFPSISKEFRGHGSLRGTSQFLVFRQKLFKWIGPVVEK